MRDKERLETEREMIVEGAGIEWHKQFSLEAQRAVQLEEKLADRERKLEELRTAAEEVTEPTDGDGFCDGCSGYHGIEFFEIGGLKCSRQAHKDDCWYGILRAAIERSRT